MDELLAASVPPPELSVEPRSPTPSEADVDVLIESTGERHQISTSPVPMSDQAMNPFAATEPEQISFIKQLDDLKAQATQTSEPTPSAPELPPPPPPAPPIQAETRPPTPSPPVAPPVADIAPEPKQRSAGATIVIAAVGLFAMIGIAVAFVLMGTPSHSDEGAANAAGSVEASAGE